MIQSLQQLIIYIQQFLNNCVTYFMSDLLISWLNDQIQLSKRVTNFEDDFNNGYLFGQLLSKYNQQLNFKDFINKDDKSSKVTNFELLFDSFKALRVTFDSNIAMSIIDRKQGIAKKVLYELKMQLEKTNQNAFPKLQKTTKTLSPLKKIQISKDQFDKVNRDHFKKQLNQLHKAQKSIVQDRVLKKFPQFHDKQVQKNQFEQEKQTSVKLMDRKRFRQRQLQNIKKSKEFREQWQRTNMDKWSVNMTTRKQQNQKDYFYKSKIETHKVHFQTMNELKDLNTFQDQIDVFQKKFLKRDDSQQQQEKQLPALQKNPSKLSVKLGLSASSFPKQDPLGKKKRNIVGQQNLRHQREKRRRKMIVQQNKRHQFIEINRRERYIISIIQQTSKQQKQLEYEIWRAWQNKEIMKQNRKLINDNTQEKQEIRNTNSNFKDQQLLKTLRQQHDNQLKVAVERHKKLQADNKVAQRKAIYSQCWKLVQNIIDITENCYNFQQQTNKQQLNPAFLNHILSEFVANATNPKDIAKLQLENYIQGKGQWKIQPKRQTEQIPSDPTIQNALPNTPTNNYFLGNILKNLFCNLYPPQAENKQISQKLQPELCVCLLGLQFAGKKILGKQLKQRYGINCIQIQTLIIKRVEEFQTMRSKNLQVSEQTTKLIQMVSTGKKISNEIILKLLQEQLLKNPKSVIIDYPITYQQATQLTCALSQIQPKDNIPPTKLQIKIKEFSRLAKPSPPIIVPLGVKSCGIDFALWIDVPSNVSLDRFLGRRYIGNQAYHIKQDIPNVNTLQLVKDKASPIILQNNFKLNNKQKVENWFKLFGTEIVIKQGDQKETKQILRAWQNIDGSCSVDSLKQQMFQKFNATFQFKEKKKKMDYQKLQMQKQEKLRIQQEKIYQEELKGKCVLSSGEEIKKQLVNAQNAVSLDKEFVQMTTNAWNQTQSNTINCLLETFQKVRMQEEDMRGYLAQLRRSYIGLLTRQDEKFYLVKKFQNEYNKFFDNQNDMINYQYTKEELHQRIEDLEDQLLNIIQIKKQEAFEQRNNIMSSGWLQSQLERFFLCMQIIVQVQLQRSAVSQQIIGDFYSKKYSIEQKQPEEGNLELNIDNSLEILKQDNYPRVEKLFSQAMRLFNKQEQQVDDKNKKGGKGAKKQDKKAAKKGGKQQVEQKSDPTPQQLEMKKAINTQKAIFRYRLNILNTYCKNKLKNIKQSGEKLYRDLEDLYLYTNKVQNKSVFNLTQIFKKAIENQQKIENQVQINYAQVTQTQLIRNFERPKTVISSAKEPIKSNRFTIANLYQIIQILKSQAEKQQKISTKKILILFEKFRKGKFAQSFLPNTWQQLTNDNYQHFVKILDPKASGQVSIWKVILFALMTNFKIPQPEQLKKYRHHLTGYNDTITKIDKEKLIKTQAWFDEELQTVENARTFDRNKEIKVLLYQIFETKDETESYLHLEKFLQALSLQIFNKQKMSETYYDFAFM